MQRAELAGRVLSTTPAEVLLRATERFPKWPANRLTVLTYHRVCHRVDDGRHPGLISATPQLFAQQMRTLSNRYRVVHIDDVLAAIAREAPLPDRSLLLTFDDAVEDFHEHAWPVLNQLGLPAVVFVPTAFAGDAEAVFWWDALHAAFDTTAATALARSPIGAIPLATQQDRSSAFRTMRDYLKRIPYSEVDPIVTAICDDLVVTAPTANVMSWDTLRHLAAQGVGVCAHTRTHPHLDQIPIEQVVEEVSGSLADLQHQLGSVPLAFAYPGGQLTSEVTGVVRETGFRAAFSTRGGQNIVGSCDPLTFRRINVGSRAGLGAARLQMHPWADRLPRGQGTRR